MSATWQVGIAIREAREEAGMSQTELANRMGIAQSAVSRMEAGRQNLRVGTLSELAAALGMPLRFRIGDSVAVLWQGATS